MPEVAIAFSISIINSLSNGSINKLWLPDVDILATEGNGVIVP